MDLSKLPRLSTTPSPPPEPAPTAAGSPPAPPTIPGGEPGRRGAFCDQCGASLRAGARFCDSCGRPTTSAAEPTVVPEYRNVGDPAGGIAIDIWFSLILGVIFLFMGSTAGHYAATKLAHRTWHTGYFWMEGTPKANQEVTVEELDAEKRSAFDQQMLSESGLFIFGVILIVDAAVRLLAWVGVPGRRAIVALGLLATSFAVVYNLYVVLRLLKVGVTPIFSLLCIAFGGYVLFAQWITVRAMTPAAPRAAPGT